MRKVESILAKYVKMGMTVLDPFTGKWCKVKNVEGAGGELISINYTEGSCVLGTTLEKDSDVSISTNLG